MKIIAYQYEAGTIRILYLLEDNKMYVAACEDLNGMLQFVRHSCPTNMEGAKFHEIAALHNN